MVSRLRAFASSGTALATPWAEKITGRSPAGASASSLDEDDALRLERIDDVLVVDDLVPHVHRRAVDLERLLDHVDRAHDAGAEAARRAENDAERRFRCSSRSSALPKRPCLGKPRRRSQAGAPRRERIKAAARPAPSGPPHVRRLRRPRRRARFHPRLGSQDLKAAVGLRQPIAVRRAVGLDRPHHRHFGDRVARLANAIRSK